MLDQMGVKRGLLLYWLRAKVLASDNPGSSLGSPTYSLYTLLLCLHGPEQGCNVIFIPTSQNCLGNWVREYKRGLSIVGTQWMTAITFIDIIIIVKKWSTIAVFGWQGRKSLFKLPQILLPSSEHSLNGS